LFDRFQPGRVTEQFFVPAQRPLFGRKLEGVRIAEAQRNHDERGRDQHDRHQGHHDFEEWRERSAGRVHAYFPAFFVVPMADTDPPKRVITITRTRVTASTTIPSAPAPPKSSIWLVRTLRSCDTSDCLGEPMM